MKFQSRAVVISVDYPAALRVIAPYPAFCEAVVPAVPVARYCKRSFGFSRLLSLPLSMQDTADWVLSSWRIHLSMSLSGLWFCRSSRLWDNIAVYYITHRICPISANLSWGRSAQRIGNEQGRWWLKGIMQRKMKQELKELFVFLW